MSISSFQSNASQRTLPITVLLATGVYEGGVTIPADFTDDQIGRVRQAFRESLTHSHAHYLTSPRDPLTAATLLFGRCITSILPANTTFVPSVSLNQEPHTDSPTSSHHADTAEQEEISNIVVVQRAGAILLGTPQSNILSPRDEVAFYVWTANCANYCRIHWDTPSMYWDIVWSYAEVTKSFCAFLLPSRWIIPGLDIPLETLDRNLWSSFQDLSNDANFQGKATIIRDSLTAIASAASGLLAQLREASAQRGRMRDGRRRGMRGR